MHRFCAVAGVAAVVVAYTLAYWGSLYRALQRSIRAALGWGLHHFTCAFWGKEKQGVNGAKRKPASPRGPAGCGRGWLVLDEASLKAELLFKLVEDRNEEPLGVLELVDEKEKLHREPMVNGANELGARFARDERWDQIHYCASPLVQPEGSGFLLKCERSEKSSLIVCES